MLTPEKKEEILIQLATTELNHPVHAGNFLKKIMEDYQMDFIDFVENNQDALDVFDINLKTIRTPKPGVAALVPYSKSNYTIKVDIDGYTTNSGPEQITQ